MHRTTLSAAFGALAFVAAALPAHATYVCDIQRTPDGFVALRANPSPEATLLARMRPGQMVRLGERSSGAWRQVTYWAGGQVPTENDAAHRQGRRGWVHGQLLGDCG